MNQQQTSSLNYPHKKQFRYEFTKKISFCFNCSSAIIKSKTGPEISTIKPLKHHLQQESSLPIFAIMSDCQGPYKFLNKSGYIKIRKEIIKNMKFFCNYFKLNNKTFFLALDYVDRICSRMLAFDFEDLKQISQICIILASKLQENQMKGIELKKIAHGVSTNYAKDELYLLALLNHDLIVFTSYDILMDMLKCGFFFNDEDFSVRKLNSIYGEIENILYLFSETKFYIEMSPKEVAMSIIGFIRETLGLIAFNQNVQTLFMNEYIIYTNNCLDCLNKLRKCFKFKDNQNANNQNNSNQDNKINSNSDKNSDYISENNSETIKNNNNLGKKM
jgi:hypothetical protein